MRVRLLSAAVTVLLILFVIIFMPCVLTFTSFLKGGSSLAYTNDTFFRAAAAVGKILAPGGAFAGVILAYQEFRKPGGPQGNGVVK